MGKRGSLQLSSLKDLDLRFPEGEGPDVISCCLTAITMVIWNLYHHRYNKSILKLEIRRYTLKECFQTIASDRHVL